MQYSISAVIPCWNEERTIYHSIISAGCFADEILIFDDESDDKSRDRINIAATYSKVPVRYFFGRLRNNPAVRNELIKKAKGRIIVSMDADCCFIDELKSEFLAELSDISPGEFVRFRTVLVGKNLHHTAETLYSPPDVSFSAFIKQDGMQYYADDAGFAKFKAANLVYSNNAYAFHFKYNKSAVRLAKRCVYREHVRTGKPIDELFAEKYGHINFEHLDRTNLHSDEGEAIPEKYRGYKIYNEVVEYVYGHYDI